MKKIEILAAFEREINKLDDNLSKPVTDDSVYWINQAISKFSKERFNGNAPHRTSYEQNEKRLRDLNNLYTLAYCNIPQVIEGEPITVDEIVGESSMYYTYRFVYPEDVMFILNEDVIITDPKGNHPYHTSVFECTKDNFMYRITNSLTDFHYRHHKARPLRLVVNQDDNKKGRTHVWLYTEADKDGNQTYKIKELNIGYLRFPNKFDLNNPAEEYTDFTDIVLYEIVKIAAQMYLENQGDQRYRTITNEVLTQE